MIAPEHAALATAIMEESDATWDEAVELAAAMMKHLRGLGYELRARESGR